MYFRIFFISICVLALACACGGQNVRVEGGGTNRDASGAVLIGTSF